MIGGVLLGQMSPVLFQAIGRMEVAHVNIPVGLLIWVMIVPMLVKIDFAAMTQVRHQWRGIGVTLFVNWLVKPFFNGAAGLDLHSPSVCAVAAGRATRQLYRRLDPAGGRAMYRDGVRSGRSFAEAIRISRYRRSRSTTRS